MGENAASRWAIIACGAMNFSRSTHRICCTTAVAPNVAPAEGLPHHEWLIEFSKAPNDPDAFALEVDKQLRKLNVYYDDLISGAILCTLVITALRKNAFIDYMKSLGKLGGQNKVPRLSNDRKIAEDLVKFAG